MGEVRSKHTYHVFVEVLVERGLVVESALELVGKVYVVTFFDLFINISVVDCCHRAAGNI